MVTQWCLFANGKTPDDQPDFRFVRHNRAILSHMTRQTFIVMRVIFSLMIVVGLVVGFSSVRANGFDCGSVFVGRSSVERSFDEVDATLRGSMAYDTAPCEDELSSHSTIAWAFLLVGGIGNAIAFVMRPSKNPAQNQPIVETAARRHRPQKSARDSAILVPGWHPDPDDANLLAYWDGEQWFDPDSQLPAGWYPDPDDANLLAYWDGEDWVEMDERFPNR